MLSREGFLVIFVLISLLLFNWHSIGLSEKVDELASYKYLFGVWAIIILVLFLVSTSHLSLLNEGDGRRENGNNSNNGGMDDNAMNNEEGYSKGGTSDKNGR